MRTRSAFPCILPVFLATLLAFSCAPLRAQVVNDGATNTLNSVTNLFAGSVLVGSNGPGTLLVLTNGTLLSNAAHAVIGASSLANGNTVRLSGAGTRWLMGNLFVGSNGSFNRLLISDGARVGTAGGLSTIGYLAASRSNELWVTGAGSVWSNVASATIGFSGTDNRLVVSNGGLALSQTGYLGRQTGSTSNLVVVTGAGSLWSNQSTIHIGFNDGGNALVVEDGGRVTTDGAYLGSSGLSSRNSALVTGAGSWWSILTDFYLGGSGGTNQLVVSNSGTVTSGYAYIGSSGSVGHGNAAMVTGSGSVWSNEYEFAVGYATRDNRLTVSDGGRVVTTNGSVGYGTTALNNETLVTGPNSAWENRGDLFVGYQGDFNRLVVSNGGRVSAAGNGIIGFDSFAQSNTMVVTGPGSSWFNPANTGFYVGSNSSFNRLLVSAGGGVTNGPHFIGQAASAANNETLVTGNGSSLNALAALIVGQAGGGNRLIVSNGATVASASGVIGQTPTATNNLAVVAGPGSRWLLNGSLYVGSNGTVNRLVVSNGGLVQNTFGIIGVGVTGNVVEVTGANSRWNPFSALQIGAGNQLLITGGGTVDAGSASMGNLGSVEESFALVSGPGSLWTNRVGIFVGSQGGHARLVVSNGGTAISSNLFVGANATSTNNRVIVDGGNLRVVGAGSFDIRRGTNVFNAGLIEADRLWLTNNLGVFEFNGGTLMTGGGAVSNGQSFVVGASGATAAILDVRVGVPLELRDGFTLGANTVAAGNQLLITNGGKLSVAEASHLGTNAASSNNVALVTGAGSLWTNRGNLFFGNSGSGNQLMVSNGGTVVNATGYIGFNATASGNVALVSGGGSLWSNRSDLIIGQAGAGNQLVVSNGGRVTVTSNAFIGFNPSGFSNDAVVTGVGASWVISNTLMVGSNSSFNRLFVASSGQSSSSNSYVGFAAESSNNVAVVTGGGSLWTNRDFLTIGRDGSGNQMVVSNAGMVGNPVGYVGFSASASNNVALVTGAGSVWNNSSALSVGISGSRNLLVVSNSGTVVSFSGSIGLIGGAVGNLGVVTGSGSLWSNRGDLFVGDEGRGNQLVVSNGGMVVTASVSIGGELSSSSNTLHVTGAESRLVSSNLYVGETGGWNRLLVTDGGTVISSNGYVGFNPSSSNNLAIISGAGSVWSNLNGLDIGFTGNGNQLIVSNGGLVTARRVEIGFGGGAIPPFGVNNRIEVDGGTLRVTNAGGTASLNVLGGTNVLNAGLIEANRLLLTNGSLSRFAFNGGTLSVRGTTVNNGLPFIVGNGTSSATLNLAGNGQHRFANNLIVSSNAQLTGNGTLFTTSVASFGTIAPGNSAGALTIATNLQLFDSAKLTFELGGLIATNDYDRINVGGLLQMAGTLSLELINNFLPEPEHTFTLLTFGSQSGSFTNIIGGRVSLTDNLASFAVTQTATNLQLSGVTYVDTDGDGQGDLQELAAGTSPTDSAAYLQITSLMQNGSGHYVIQFQSVLGKSYRIEWTDNFATWNSVLSPVLTSPAPGISQWIDDGTLTGGLPASRSYRIGLQ